MKPITWIVLALIVAFVVFAAANGWRMVGNGQVVTSNRVKRDGGGNPSWKLPPPESVRPLPKDQSADNHSDVHDGSKHTGNSH